jgi:TRAP transporter 4TM/12TM fusion protein
VANQIILTKIFQTVLIFSVLAWTVNLPDILGLLVFGEQFLIIVLGSAIVLVFLTPDDNKLKTITNYSTILVTIITFSYFFLNYEYLINELAYLPLDGIIVSLITVLLCLEATRRVVGPFITVVAILFIVYALFGHYLPDDYASRPLLTSRLIIYLGIDTNAIFGKALDIGVFVIVPFLLMGKLLTLCGGSEFFSDLSTATMGRSKGGAAKISLIGSILFGSISGSAVANVAGTGIITIPMMKKSGFPPRIAASIEAVASTGGQLMPPVMGASAFLMSEFLEISYATIMLAALTPAILYYAALFIYVDLKARELNLQQIPEDLIPSIKDVLKKGWFIPLPFVIFLGSIFAYNVQPENAALLAGLLLIIIGFTSSYGGQRISLKQLWDSILSTSTSAIEIIIICAVAGIVIGTLNLSGLAFNLSQQLVLLSGDNVFALLFMAALVSIILGMGMPTVGVYIMLAALVAPAIIETGISPIVAHMFVLYFGMLSMITPPVALASAVAAKLADTDPWQTASTSMKVGWVAYIVPFIFVSYPALLLIGTAIEFLWGLIISLSIIVAGTVVMSGFFIQKITLGTRMLLSAAILVIVIGNFIQASNIITETIGLIVIYSLFGFLYVSNRKA